MIALNLISNIVIVLCALIKFEPISAWHEEIGFVTARPVSIRLNRKALVRRGHPWVYAGGLERCREPADSNGLGVLYDEKNDFGSRSL